MCIYGALDLYMVHIAQVCNSNSWEAEELIVKDNLCYTVRPYLNNQPANW